MKSSEKHMDSTSDSLSVRVMPPFLVLRPYRQRGTDSSGDENDRNCN